MWRVRNFHQGFEHGLLEGLASAAVQQVMFGARLGPDATNQADYRHMARMDELGPPDLNRGPIVGNARGDGKLTFDRLTDVFHSGTRHDEDQPVHLVVEDLNICSNRCTVEFGNPCQYFCPAAVYEMVDGGAGPEAASEGVGRGPKKELRINFTNCVHCKTCDIMDPYQIINWVPPEGGGGPNYDGM
jgi:electron-transferring-flavoprotein dehydrogenase